VPRPQGPAPDVVGGGWGRGSEPFPLWHLVYVFCIEPVTLCFPVPLVFPNFGDVPENSVHLFGFCLGGNGLKSAFGAKKQRA